MKGVTTEEAGIILAEARAKLDAGSAQKRRPLFYIDPVVTLS
jgi:hypothetical protein